MTQNRIIEMAASKIKRCEILKMAEKKKVTQQAGTRQIEVSERHFRRLLRRYRLDEPAGIISGHSNKPSNNQMPPLRTIIP